MSIISSQHLCHNCLAPGHHGSQTCQCSHRSRKCSRSHHTLYHDEARVSKSSASALDFDCNLILLQPLYPLQVLRFLKQLHSQLKSQLKSTLLMTSQVIVKSSLSNKLQARILLDTGATISLVDCQSTQITEHIPANLNSRYPGNYNST